jgi:hypothetical protein
MAIASTDELEHHLITARDRAAIDDPTYVRLLDRLIEVRRMLYGLQRALHESMAGATPDPARLTAIGQPADPNL